jgi:hypothetical protein
MAIWDNSSSPVSSTDMGLVVKPPPEGRNPVVLPPGQLETERDLGTLQDTAVGVGQGATFGNLSDVSQGLVVLGW